MRVYCLSGDPNRPCLVVRFKTTTLMLDAGLELNSLVHFLPLVVGRDKTGQKQKMNSFVPKVGWPRYWNGVGPFFRAHKL